MGDPQDQLFDLSPQACGRWQGVPTLELSPHFLTNVATIGHLLLSALGNHSH